MQLSDFHTGVTYSIKKKDWEAPIGEIVPGRTLTRKILEPVSKTNSTADGETPTDMEIEGWQAFLRVQDVDSGKIHLLHPEMLLDAAIVATDKVKLGDQVTWLGRKHGSGSNDARFIVGQRYPVAHIYLSNLDVELQGEQPEITTRAGQSEFSIGSGES